MGNTAALCGRLASSGLWELQQRLWSESARCLGSLPPCPSSVHSLGPNCLTWALALSRKDTFLDFTAQEVYGFSRQRLSPGCSSRPLFARLFLLFICTALFLSLGLLPPPTLVSPMSSSLLGLCLLLSLRQPGLTCTVLPSQAHLSPSTPARPDPHRPPRPAPTHTVHPI